MNATRRLQVLLIVVTVPCGRCVVATSRTVAHNVLCRVAKDGAFADRTLAAALAREMLQPAQARHATELVYGVLRHGRQLDFSLSQFATLQKTDMPTTIALRIGAYELLYLRTTDYAAVHEAVGLSNGKRRQSFVNAVLRRITRERDSLPSPEDALESPEAALAVSTSMPDWLLAELGRTHLTSFHELSQWAHANQLRPCIALRVNRVATNLVTVQKELLDAGIDTEHVAIGTEHVTRLPDSLILPSGSGAVPLLPGFDRGAWSVQDVAAQLVGLLAAPSPGQVVLDLCSAPGGKTTHLAELMHDDGLVVAVELHERKLKLIRAACERLQLRCVRPYACDASKAEALLGLLKENGANAADHVVLDAPCSGMGTLRRHPEHRYRSGEHVPQLTALQDRLLDAAAQCVRPGGSLTYSVCSPIACEGVDRVAAFLSRNSAFECPPITDETLVPFTAASETLGGEARTLQTWTHRHPNCDSFFACRLVRRLPSTGSPIESEADSLVGN